MGKRSGHWSLILAVNGSENPKKRRNLAVAPIACHITAPRPRQTHFLSFRLDARSFPRPNILKSPLTAGWFSLILTWCYTVIVSSRGKCFRRLFIVLSFIVKRSYGRFFLSAGSSVFCAVPPPTLSLVATLPFTVTHLTDRAYCRVHVTVHLYTPGPYSSTSFPHAT